MVRHRGECAPVWARGTTILIGNFGGKYYSCFYCFYEETALENLWVPKDADAYENKRWSEKKFPEQIRRADVIIEAPNVLVVVMMMMITMTIEMTR